MTASEPLPPQPDDSLWRDGWYRFAAHQPSPNHGPRPRGSCIDLIVLHSISLPPGQYGGDEVQQLFTNQLDWQAHPYFESIRGLTVSSHFFVRRSGELWQFVSCDDRAWHAGVSSYRGRSNCNNDSIGIELEGLEGTRFEPAQYATLAAVCASILQHYPVHHLAGHEHIAPGRKGDPGPGFDWLHLQKTLALSSSYLPQGLQS